MAEKKVRALPGRVILKFPPKVEKTSGGLIVPETSQLRPELGEVVDVGEAITDADVRVRGALLELQRTGAKVPVTMMSGTRFWDETKATAQAQAEWGWLSAYRAYRIGELAAFLEEG